MSALSDHQRISADLAANLRELSLVRGQSLQAYSDTWRAMTSSGVTDRRESAKDSAVMWDKQALILQGEIDAQRVELRHLELILAHADA